MQQPFDACDDFTTSRRTVRLELRGVASLHAVRRQISFVAGTAEILSETRLSSSVDCVGRIRRHTQEPQTKSEWSLRRSDA